MSRAGRILRIFGGNKDKLLRQYIHHKNIYMKGKSEIGLAYDFIQLQSFMVGWLFLRDIWGGIPTWTIVVVYPLLLLLKVAVYYPFGYWWDKNRVFDKEQDWFNSRDPVAKTLSKKILDGEGIT